MSLSSSLINDLPPVRGKLRLGATLAPITWLRVGGPADILFQPVDADDLALLLRALPSDVSVLPMGVASNLLVRDGGVRGVVVRFAGVLSTIDAQGARIHAGAGALDRKVAMIAQRAGIAGLEFLFGVPGTIGGAVRMNAGAFGGETADHLESIEVVTRDGRKLDLPAEDLSFDYRWSSLPSDVIVTSATFRGVQGDPVHIAARMAEIKAEREARQPVRVATGGSTFKNPQGCRAWQLIDEAGCRGLRQGGAVVSDKHCNFLINEGKATAEDLETLGETVRDRVHAHSGVRLQWEIHRVGEMSSSAEAAA